jgi:hypothetical protein
MRLYSKAFILIKLKYSQLVNVDAKKNPITVIDKDFAYATWKYEELSSAILLCQ